MNTLLRKLIASASVIVVISGLMVSTVSAATFSDVSTDDMWYDAVEQGVVDGTFSSAEKFNSFDTVNRAMMAVIAVKAGGFEMEDAGTVNPFPDVPADHWAADAIFTGVKNGLFKGYDNGSFGPGDSLTRGQAAIILMNTFAFDATQECGATFPDVSSSHYAADAISQAWCWSWINGYDNGKFGPNDSLLRYQIAIMTNNAKHNAVWREWTGETPVDPRGSLTITEGNNMPNGGTVPKAATNVNFLSFALTAGDEEASVDNLVLGRQGVGTTQDIAAVYLYESNNRLTTGRTISSDDNTVEFSSLGWTLAPGETRHFDVRVDIASNATASDEHRLYIYSLEGADEVGGEVNLAGPYFTIGGQSAGTVLVEKNGSLVNPTLGQSGAKISQFKVTPDNEDVTLKWVNLYVTGTISSNEVSNFKLYQGTTVSEANLVAEAEGISDRDTANFDLGDGIMIEDGKQETFIVTADLDGDVSDTVVTYIDENSDVYAEGDVYGTGSGIDKTAFDSDTNDKHTVTLQGGDVTFNFNGPVAGDVSTDQQKVTFLDFSIKSERDIEVKKLVVTVDDTACNNAVDDEDLIRGSGTEANFKNIRIMEGDKNVMETESLTLTTGVTADDCSQDLTFTDSFYVDGGETKNLSVKMDIDNNATAAETVRVTLGAIASDGIKDVSTNKFVATTEIVPSSSLVGNVQTLVSSSLTIGHASTPTFDTFVKGTKNVPVVGFLFKTGTAEPVKVTSVELAGYIDEDADDAIAISATGADNGVSLKDVINNIRLYEDGYAADKTPVAGPESVETDGTVVFSDMNYSIAKSTTKRLVVVGDISASAFVNSDAEIVSFDIADVSADVVAEDEDGDDISSSITGDASNGGATPTAYVTTGDTGTLTVATKSSQAASNIVIAGRSGVELGRFEFASVTEDITVQDVTLAYGSSSAGDADEVTEVYVYDADDLTTPLGSGFVQSGVVDINGINLVVPSDEKAVLVVAADLTTLPQGADSGSAIAVGLKSVDKAQGQAGTNVTVDADTDLTCGVVTLTTADATATAMTLSAACTEIAVGDIVYIDDTTDEYVLVLDKDSNNDGTETDYVVVRAIGGSTGSAHAGIVINAGNTAVFKARSNYMVVRETKPTFATVSYPSGTKLENGAGKGIYKFTVQAEAEEDVDLNALVFTVTGKFGGKTLSSDTDGLDGNDDEPDMTDGSATDGTDGLSVWTAATAPTVVVTGVQLYDITDGEYVSGATYTYANSNTGTGYILVTFGNSEEVSASGRTYELRADVSGVANNADYLSVLINDNASTRRNLITSSATTVKALNTLAAGANVIATDVVWSDESSTSHTISTSDFTNAYLLKSLKTVAQTMTFTTGS